MPSAQPVATSPPDARRWTPTGHCKASQGPCSAVPRRAPCPAGFASVREFRERRETNSAAISAGAVSEKHSSTAPTSAAAASLRAFAQLSTGTRFSSQNFRCSSRHAFILRKAANRSCFAGTQNSGRGLLRSLSEPFEQSASRTWVDQAANFDWRDRAKPSSGASACALQESLICIALRWSKRASRSYGYRRENPRVPAAGSSALSPDGSALENASSALTLGTTHGAGSHCRYRSSR